jgi:hypothetical protein
VGRRRAEGSDLDRERESAEDRNPFRFIGDHDHLRRCGSDDFLAQQRRTTAFDQRQVRRNLVGAVHGEIKRRGFVEGRE